jgi:hypothetical protein
LGKRDEGENTGELIKDEDRSRDVGAGHDKNLKSLSKTMEIITMLDVMQKIIQWRTE